MFTTVMGQGMKLVRSMLSSTLRFTGSLITGISSGIYTSWFTDFTNAFLPIAVPIAASVAFILVDFIFGYIVGRKYGYKKLLSNKLWRTLGKLTEAILLIAGAFVLDVWVITSVYLHLVEIMAGMICFTELWSLLESYCELSKDNRIILLLSKVVLAKGKKYLDVEITDQDLKSNRHGHNDKDTTRVSVSIRNVDCASGEQSATSESGDSNGEK